MLVRPGRYTYMLEGTGVPFVALPVHIKVAILWQRVWHRHYPNSRCCVELVLHKVHHESLDMTGILFWGKMATMECSAEPRQASSDVLAHTLGAETDRVMSEGALITICTATFQVVFAIHCCSGVHALSWIAGMHHLQPTNNYHHTKTRC